MGRTCVLLGCLLVAVTQLLPVSTQNSSTPEQTSLREELREVTSGVELIMDMAPTLKDKLQQLTARMDSQENVKSQSEAIIAQAQDIHEQGEAIKVQGHAIKVQGQAVQRIVNDLKIHGTDLKELVEVIEDLGTSFRDLRNGIANELDNQERKIAWAITDGSLSPRNTSWVETNFQALLDHANKQGQQLDQQGRQLEELREKMDNLTLFTEASHSIDCSAAVRSGVYTITYGFGLKSNAYCLVDHTGKWTVIQRRQDGSTSFSRNWADYSRGFGDVEKEFWLGNEKIHALTAAAGLTRLRIDLMDWENTKYTVYYDVFQVAGAEDKYKLTVSGFAGSKPPGDSMAYNTGMEFTTKDEDNDNYGGNCASSYGGGGGWWFNACTRANLNGRYNSTGGIYWYTWRVSSSLKAATMMLSKP